MSPGEVIFVAGHKGMVGSAIIRRLKTAGFTNIVTRTKEELNLLNQQDVNAFFESVKPAYVFLAAAKVGGIQANNQYRADFIYENLMIEANIIHASWKFNCRKLLFLGSSCIYPKLAPQPLKEEYLLQGYLEETNEPYAIAKIAGIKLCESYHRQYGCNFISAMPTNMYGPNDNYDLNNSHVLPALIRKMHVAKKTNEKEVVVWGSGNPMREFMHVDDLADACLFMMNEYEDPQFLNVGTGVDISIKDLALLIRSVVGFGGEIVFDNSKPDGTPRKLMDVNRIHNIGWKHKIDLEDGIKSVYSGLTNQEWY